MTTTAIIVPNWAIWAGIAMWTISTGLSLILWHIDRHN